MPISETAVFSFAFALTVAFSLFSFAMKEYMYRMFFKVISSVCWFMLALMLFALGDVASAAVIAFTYLMSGIGIIFSLLTIFEWRGEEKGKFEREASQ